MKTAGSEVSLAQTLLVLTGPESSGKTTLAVWLAARLHAPLVPEAARRYLAAKLTLTYDSEDVRAIAAEQAQAEQRALAGGAPVVVADTDQRILHLWWAEKYPNLTSDFETHPQADSGGPRRAYLLCYPDLAWEPDPLRENPQDRARLFKAQLQALEQDNAEFRVIWGEGSIRQRRALHYAQQVLGPT